MEYDYLLAQKYWLLMYLIIITILEVNVTVNLCKFGEWIPYASWITEAVRLIVFAYRLIKYLFVNKIICSFTFRIP